MSILWLKTDFKRLLGLSSSSLHRERNGQALDESGIGLQAGDAGYFRSFSFQGREGNRNQRSKTVGPGSGGMDPVLERIGQEMGSEKAGGYWDRSRYCSHAASLPPSPSSSTTGLAL